MPFGELAALANAALWASTGVVTKALSPVTRPIQIVAAQSWVSLLATLVLIVAVGQMDDMLRMPLGAAAFLAGAALLNTFGSYTFFLSVALGSVGRVYPITQGLYILLALGAAGLFLDDPPGPILFVGATAIIVGVTVLTLARSRRIEGATDELAGNLKLLGLAAATAVLWVGAFVFTALGLEETELLPATFLRNTVPAALYALVMIWSPRNRISRVPAADHIKLLLSSVFYLSALLTFNYALQNGSPAAVSVLTSSSPMFAFTLAFVFLRERIGGVAIVGAAICVVGIVSVVALR